LHGLVDSTKIGVSGLSLGGLTAYGVGFNTCCIDERVDVFEVFSGFRLAFTGGDYVFRPVPLLIMHATECEPFGYDTARESFGLASPPVVFVTLEGCSHSEPYEDAANAHDDAVIEISTRFWRVYLTGDNSAAAGLTTSADPLVRIESR
jgi:hypothetical protein